MLRFGRLLLLFALGGCALHHTSATAPDPNVITFDQIQMDYQHADKVAVQAIRRRTAMVMHIACVKLMNPSRRQHLDRLHFCKTNPIRGRRRQDDWRSPAWRWLSTCCAGADTAADSSANDHREHVQFRVVRECDKDGSSCLSG